MAASIVQHTSDINDFFPIALPFVSSNTAGNSIIVVAGIEGLGGAPTISDSQGNSYSLVVSQALTGAQSGAYLWRADGIKAGANTVTVTSASGVGGICIYETTPLNPVDQKASDYFPTGNTPALTPVTTQFDGELCFCAGASVTGNAYTAGTGWHLDTGGTQLGSQSQVQATAGSLTGAINSNTGGNALILATFPEFVATHSISGNAGTIYKTLAVETGENASNPMDPENWSYVTNLPAVYGVLLATGTEIESTITAALESSGVYTGKSFPDDQWAELQIDNVLSDGNTTAILAIRATPKTAASPSAYVIEVDGPLGPSCNVSFYSLILGVVGTIAFESTTTVNVGSVIRLEAIGTTITALIDGVVLAQLTSNTDSTSGWPRIVLFPESAETDVQVSNFQAGSLIVLPSVTITWTGTSSGTTTTDDDGNYTIPDLANGSYTITPSLTGYHFTPTSQDETLSGADITGVDFTAALNKIKRGTRSK
jgi:CarboxypepD_reg-like domain